MLAALDEDDKIDDTTKTAIKTIFFPTAKDLSSIFLKSEEIELYYDSDIIDNQKFELKLFTNGFIICHKHNKQTQADSSKIFGISQLAGKLSSFNFRQSKSDLESKKGRVQSAFLLSDIDRVESLNVWKFREIKMYLSGNKEIASSERAFAIFIIGRRSPIIVLCTSKEDMESWIDLFRVCVTGQKSKVLGRNRTTVNKRGVVFGINNAMRLRSSKSNRLFGGSIDWDDEEF